MAFLNLLVGALRGTGTGSRLAMVSSEGASIREIPIDLVSSESHLLENQITEHPVETGVDITDHIRALPLKLVLSGLFSDTAISLLDRVERGIAGEPHTIRAVQFFEELREKGYLVDIENRLKSYTGMAVESVTFNRGSNSGKSVAMQVSFKQVRFADSETLTGSAASALVSGLLGGTSNLGKLSTSAPSGATAARAGSIASRLTGLGA